ncbi:hypothetical protein JCM5805K_1371 [Lactococcus lactis subsp. lactis]|uniref:Uncharacterized protein n=1 Tax=Lactococcus lactis subsp. lactis TaxID=1360 RepID=A0A0B8QK99_LACLL|nr:hypothetical protein JCM5805K_1371 [Lactococcus lactis subsp. lactis]
MLFANLGTVEGLFGVNVFSRFDHIVGLRMQANV